MALANYKPNVDFTPTQALPQAQPNGYKGNTYDNNQTPLASLVSYVEGAPWTVTYFRQTLGAHNDLKEIDPTLDPVYQSYERINKMELRVMDDLSSSTDATEQMTRVTGGGYVYPFFIPNVNDYFIADTAYQKPALFQVTSVDRRTFRQDSVHYVEYRIVDYIDRIENTRLDLERKTTREYVFSRERLIEGLLPTLDTKQFNAVQSLKDDYQRLANYYLDEFYDRTCHTLTLPGQGAKRIYDPFLITYFMATVSYNDFAKMIDIKQLPTNGDSYIEQAQFWTCLMKQNQEEVAWCNQKMKMTATGMFDHNSWVKGLYFSRMDYIIYPVNPDTSGNTGEEALPMPISGETLLPTNNRHGKTLSIQEKQYLMINKSISSYPMVNIDEFYVLSRNFYENHSDELTLLEIMVRDYLKGASIKVEYIKHMCALYPKMERLEQFYYGPILLTLIKYTQRRTY